LRQEEEGQEVIAQGIVTKVELNRGTDNQPSFTFSELTLTGVPVLANLKSVIVRTQLEYGQTYELIIRKLVPEEPVERKFRLDEK
jgi:hypothetical protein